MQQPQQSQQQPLAEFLKEQEAGFFENKHPIWFWLIFATLAIACVFMLFLNQEMDHSVARQQKAFAAAHHRAVRKMDPILVQEYNMIYERVSLEVRGNHKKIEVE